MRCFFAMSSLLFVFLLPEGFSHLRADTKKASQAIWKISKKWTYDAQAGGASGKNKDIKVELTFTGKTKGKVARFKAGFSFPSGGKKCKINVDGHIDKGSYKEKKVPIVEGIISMEKISSSCRLPEAIKKKIRSLSISLQLGLVSKRLCVTIGSQDPAKSRDCFIKSVKKK